MSWMSSTIVQATFHDLCKHFVAEMYDEYICLPSDENSELDRVMGQYEKLGFPGAMGFTDVTLIGRSRCPYKQVHLYTGKEGKPTTAYQVMVNHSGHVLPATEGITGSTNDKTTICWDAAVDQIRKDNKYKDIKLDAYNEDGTARTLKRCYLLVDNGHHKANLSPRDIRSTRRSQTRSPRTGPEFATRFELDAQANLSPKAARSRPCHPSRSPLIDPGSATRSEIDAQRRFEFKNFFAMLTVKRILPVLTVIAMVALAIFYGQTDGPKLVKRNAALVPGDRLKGGEYISFCTSIISTGCKPKYLLLSRDGSLGVYEGSGPHARTNRLWSASMDFKGNAQSMYELNYTGDKIILNEDGKVKWTSYVKALPENLQPWPFRA